MIMKSFVKLEIVFKMEIMELCILIVLVVKVILIWFKIVITYIFVLIKKRSLKKSIIL